jgi:DNA-binding MarR family transcriptional regulator
MIHTLEIVTDIHVTELSKLLFGNRDRVLVAAAVADAEAGTLFARALAGATGLTDSRVQKQLKQFEAAGLLVRMPQVGGERCVFYERRPSAYWDAAIALAQEWTALTGI